MLTTALQGEAAATLLSSRGHHISDFLPAEELNKFLKKAKGEPVPATHADKCQLDRSNIGYQLLEKGGWAAGSGLGSTSSSASSGNTSIVEPIRASAQSTSAASSAGVGVVPGHEVAEGDDEFDSYRKRMMLSYRFRPNPMNNPRRDYY